MAESIEIFSADTARRAVLFRAGARPGVRTALWVVVRPAMLAPGHAFDGAAGFWLVESNHGLVSCHASPQAPNGRSVGGRVVHGLPALDPDAEWLSDLAEGLARAPETDSSADVERTVLRRAVSAFCAELDAEILAVMREDTEATPATYNHYCANNLVLRRNRLQAAASYPRFAPALRQDWGLQRAVDTGAELTPRLAALYGVQAATIKRLGRLPRECAPGAEMRKLCTYVDALPANMLPVSAEDWSVYRRLAPGLDALRRQANIAPTALLRPFDGGWAKGLLRLEQRLRAPLDFDAIVEMMHCAYHYGVRPAVAAAMRKIGRSAELAERAPAPFFPLWFGRYGLARLAEMARQWQEAHGRFSLERLGGKLAGDNQAALAWPALLTAGASHGSLRVVELTSRAALELEGQRLNHCVASYAVKCLLAESAIFSIRDMAGVPLSTFEVRVPAQGEPALLQHHAAGNEPPSPQEQGVAQRFVARVLARIPQQRIDAVLQRRRELGLRVRNLLGEPNTLQEPLSAQELSRLGEAIAFAHPAEARHAGLIAYLVKHGVPVLADMGIA
jgi:hypothetical protein